MFVSKKSWRRLQDIFSVIIFLSSKTSWRRKMKDEKLILWRQVEDVFTTSWKPTNVSWIINSAHAFITRTTCITDIFIMNNFLNMFFAPSVYTNRQTVLHQKCLFSLSFRDIFYSHIKNLKEIYVYHCSTQSCKSKTCKRLIINWDILLSLCFL